MGYTIKTGKSVQSQPRRTRSRQETTVGAAVLRPTNEDVSSAVERAQAEQELQDALQGARNRRLNERLGVSPVTTVNPLPSVADIANSRFQPRITENGFTIVQTREATADERAARLRSRNERQGNLNEVIENGDYYLLPSSLRDLYLTGSHGLTSLYPTILLTSPRTAGIVDVSTGLTTTPFIIDLNNEVKKSIEFNVRSLIDQNSSILGLASTQFNQNLQIAQQYADICLRASLIKDKLVSLFNVTKIDPQSISQTILINTVINGDQYKFLENSSSVIEFLKSIADFKDQDFELGTNTRNLAQVLKVLYDLIIFNDIEADDSEDTEIIKGYVNRSLNSAVRNLQFLDPSVDDGATRTDDINFNLFKNDNTLTSLACVLQRDLIAQSSKSQISSQFTIDTAESFQSSFGQLIGRYEDVRNGSTRPSPVLLSGFKNTDDILNYSGTRTYEIFNLTVANFGTDLEKFGKLDSDKGIDYLLYKGLAESNEQANTQSMRDFAISYASLSNKISRFYQIIFREDAVRKTVAKKFSDMVLSYIEGSKIDKTEFSSEASAVRTGTLMLAAVNDDISKLLFKIACLQDKINNGLSDKHDYLDLLCSALNAKISADISITNDTSLEFRSGARPDTGDIVVKDEYFKGRSISIQEFHNLTRSLEDAFAPDQLSSNDVFAQTDFSLNLTRDARAFVFYRMFLEILKKFYFEIKTNDFSYNEIQIKHKNAQFYSLKQAAKFYDLNLNDFKQAVRQEMRDYEPDSFEGLKIFNDAIRFYLTFFSPLVTKATQQEQHCLDLVNIISCHAAQLTNLTTQLQSNIESIQRILRDQQINNLESLVNCIQTEQAILKKDIANRYSNLLRGANYLPSAIDHNTAQAVNTKTVVKTSPEFADQSDVSITRKFLIVVGLPSGLLETLRYENSASTSEHLYNIDLVFKNLQITELQEEAGTRVATMQYAFSSRVFVNEGSQLTGGPDTKSSELLSYAQIAAATKYKVIDDDGNYVDATPDQITSIMGNSNVVKNHLNSHYGKLLLKTTTGISVDEEIFDIVPQQRTYPDTENLPNYTTLADLAAVNFGNSAEDQLNKERTLRDLSRAVQLSPRQHMTSMMVSKTFERIHVIPVDIDDIITRPEMNLLQDDLAYISVVAKISLSDAQPPVSLQPAPRTRSYANSLGNSLGERGDGQVTVIDLGQFDIAAQSASAVGINAAIESSNKFGGLLGGNRR